MNGDDKDNHPDSEEDAFYEANYDEDTIDYDLDTDKYLEDESFNPELTTDWNIEDSGDESLFPEESETDAEQEYEQALEYEPDSLSDAGQEDEEIWYENDIPEEDYANPWPLGLIAVAVIALLLLAAGGYGILKQRTEMHEEIRQLQAALATTSSKTEVSASRQAQRVLESQNTDLQNQLGKLQQENQSLKENLALLRAEAKSQPTASVGEKSGSAKIKPTPAVAAPKPVATPKPTPVKSAYVAPEPAATTWFVNFGSYTQEPVAKSWASRLKSDEGKVVLLSLDKGSTRYFRVRVIDLPSREIAEKIARQLEQKHNLPRLWIGKQ